jgi:hypothetical protein
MRRYFFGLRGLVGMIAFVIGFSCLAAAVSYFIRIGHLSTGPLSLPSALAALSSALVLVIGVLWVYSIIYWRRATTDAEQYRQLLGVDRRILKG